jgi:hypothetical protein
VFVRTLDELVDVLPTNGVYQTLPVPAATAQPIKL